MAQLKDLIVSGATRLVGATYASTLQLSGSLILAKTTDAGGTSNNMPALIIGGLPTAEHIEIDSNEIMAKSNGTTTGPLYLNNDGGAVYINAKSPVLATASTAVGGSRQPIYVTNAGNATAVDYAVAFTNVVATTARAVSDVLETGIWYVNGTNSTDLYSQADGVLYSEAYSSAWIGEIYQDYRTGQIALRSRNNGSWQAWRKVLDSSNYSTWAAPKSHATTATTYGAGTTANYGHVKLTSGDLNGQTYSDGVAAAAAHTHSNYVTTDTKNTAGSTTPSGTDSLYIIGALEQNANPQTYSRSHSYITSSGIKTGELETNTLRLSDSVGNTIQRLYSYSGSNDCYLPSSATTTRLLGMSCTTTAAYTVTTFNGPISITSSGIVSQWTPGASVKALLAWNGSSWTTIAAGAKGDIVYYDGTDWVKLSRGTMGQRLTINSAGGLYWG